MENYYNDERVLLALQKSPELIDGLKDHQDTLVPKLMDILTFIKEIDFKIKDNLGFDVLCIKDYLFFLCFNNDIW